MRCILRNNAGLCPFVLNTADTEKNHALALAPPPAEDRPQRGVPSPPNDAELFPPARIPYYDMRLLYKRGEEDPCVARPRAPLPRGITRRVSRYVRRGAEEAGVRCGGGSG